MLAIPREFAADSGFVNEISKRASQAFKLTDAEPSSVAFRREMQGTKDQLIAAIRSASSGAVDELRSTFLEVAEEFLETLHQLGGGYSAEQARKERANFFEGWNEIRWLVRDVRELILVSGRTENTDIIGSIAFLPFAIATRAVVAKDHLLFEEFTPFAPFIYALAVEKPKDSSVRQYMIGRSWRYLYELCEYYVLPINLEISGREIDIVEAKDFARFAFKVFQDFLKVTYDNDDPATFNAVLEQITRLFRHFTPKHHYPNSHFLKQRISQTEDREEKQNLQARLEELLKKENAAKEIQSARNEAILGLAGYILGKYFNQPDVVKNGTFYDAIRRYLPNDLIQLTEVYDAASSIKSSDFFGWSQWDLVADGEAHFIDTHTNLDRIYSVLALQILAGMSGEKIEKTHLRPSEAACALLHRVDEQGLPTALSEVISRQTGANRLLTAEEIGQADNFTILLRKAKEEADRAEQDEFIAATLDEGKVAAFIRKVGANSFRTWATSPSHGKSRGIVL